MKNRGVRIYTLLSVRALLPLLFAASASCDGEGAGLDVDCEPTPNELQPSGQREDAADPEVSREPAGGGEGGGEPIAQSMADLALRAAPQCRLMGQRRDLVEAALLRVAQDERADFAAACVEALGSAPCSWASEVIGSLAVLERDKRRLLLAHTGLWWGDRWRPTPQEVTLMAAAPLAQLTAVFAMAGQDAEFQLGRVVWVDVSLWPESELASAAVVYGALKNFLGRRSLADRAEKAWSAAMTGADPLGLVVSALSLLPRVYPSLPDGSPTGGPASDADANRLTELLRNLAGAPDVGARETWVHLLRASQPEDAAWEDRFRGTANIPWDVFTRAASHAEQMALVAAVTSQP